jgi:DNA repair exonuclease SbcCD nuclease subunit
MKLRVIHDVHIGVSRSAGTTPATQLALRSNILDNLARILPTEDGTDLMILGDLFDSFNVPLNDVIRTYVILQEWASHTGRRLYMVPGNHDLAKINVQLSSFEFISQLLERACPNSVTIVREPMLTPYGYVIPHVPNQDLFDLELTRVPECNVLFLHCNYNSEFAVHSDQSLNITEEQANACPAQKIVIAHEHQPRQSGKVVIPGNQIASSISDWQQSGDKVFVEVGTDGTIERKLATSRSEYAEMNIDQLELTDHKFIKVVGEVDHDKGNAVLSMLSKFRQKHSALVIANYVKTLPKPGEATVEQFTQGLTSIQRFSIWNALARFFSPEQIAKLREAETKK